MVDSKQYTQRILQKQLEHVQKNSDLNVSVGLENNNLFQWNICFEGPHDSLYEAGLFQATLTFPDNYPDMPPTMKFTTEMWHPNIYPDGKVCISILHPPGVDQFNTQESESERWRPVLTAENVIISVISMLMDPNTESPANVDASIQFRHDKEAYIKKVKFLTKKSIGDL
ncbi:ubiquitin conjugating enzyme, putative [Ichthyophthirius multifiliis]|uniref:Ubiquitin conjugating enzyme, putative n=1 Tax=Ichthyophthirius multifiliis TaxID=5932 RepID=G0QVA6_ICHMU|nr:ubiquitin conjugating enzyme, putative [Ichthyophthirius multifiliis]EGR30850.1 ubiquitin conjugating enzyme, putative [Ichthyophthirius multifiliis]|eukprot:XP_004032437.1 ubiquitin conjugating enzyme, putative [Ichthyophthirius multifiliis]